MQRVAAGGRGPWLGIAVVDAATTVILGVGLFGSRANAPSVQPIRPTAAASTSPAPAAAAASAPSATSARSSPNPALSTAAATSPSIPPGATASSGSGQAIAVNLATPPPGTATAAYAWIARGLGYRVRRGELPGEFIEASDAGRVVTFIETGTGVAVHGPRRITILVGTPAHGILVPAPSGDVTLASSDASAFLTRFRELSGATVARTWASAVDGEVARLVDLALPWNGARITLALVVRGGRDYLIVADGFDAGSASASTAARADALETFVNRIEWSSEPLFVSDGFAFEAPVLTTAGIRRSLPPDAPGDAGWVLFNDDAPDRWIRIDIGTASHPARVPLPPPAAADPIVLWNPSFDSLVERFFGTVGFGQSASRTEVDGAPAYRVDRPATGVGAAVLVMHDARMYVITAGPAYGGASPAFDDFLREFRFLPAR